jgi:cobalt-zinc-cadmium efflux system membrane fusion protein
MNNIMKKYIIPFIVLVFLSSCGEKAAETNTAEQTKISENIVTLTQEQRNNIKIQTESPQLMDVGKFLHLNGKLITPPQDVVQLCLALGGYVKSCNVLPGQFIEKGSTLAVIENEAFIQLQQDYLTTLSNLALAEKDYNRQKTLNSEKATSDKTADEAKNRYENQRIAAQSLREKLLLIGITPESVNEKSISRSVSIRAPFSGNITAMNIVPGRLMRPEDVLFEMKNNSHLTASLQFFEKDLAPLNENLEIDLFTNNDPDRKIKGKIISINRNFNENGASELYCSITGAPKEWVSGMYINGVLQAVSPVGIAVPMASVVHWEGKNYIFEDKQDNTFEIIEVNAREINAKFMELIVGPDFTSKKIVSEGAYTLLMKMKNTSEE